mmetsp:Transcript_29491/g.73743  ORF Transcript_29491/g.73743 Transcript_29491/m.73743 type:complete len:299 (+) Transcript_29491:3386-4282(+)
MQSHSPEEVIASPVAHTGLLPGGVLSAVEKTRLASGRSWKRVAKLQLAHGAHVPTEAQLAPPDAAKLSTSNWKPVVRSPTSDCSPPPGTGGTNLIGPVTPSKRVSWKSALRRSSPASLPYSSVSRRTSSTWCIPYASAYIASYAKTSYGPSSSKSSSEHTNWSSRNPPQRGVPVLSVSLLHVPSAARSGGRARRLAVYAACFSVPSRLLGTTANDPFSARSRSVRSSFHQWGRVRSFSLVTQRKPSPPIPSAKAARMKRAPSLGLASRTIARDPELRSRRCSFVKSCAFTPKLTEVER